MEADKWIGLAKKKDKMMKKAQPYMIGAIRAQLWYPNTGRLSKDILSDKNFVLWNTIIGEGDAEEPSLHTLVTVEIIGRPGEDTAEREVEIVCELTKPFGKRPRLLAKRIEAPQNLGKTGRWLIPVWIADHPVVPVKITATLKGQGKPIRKIATINYAGGE
jgi:hypothetical protein